MIRKVKTLGLAMVAALAMSAAVTSAAQAQFTADKYPTTVTATSPLGNDVFVVDGSSLECDAHFEGTTSEADSILTMSPTFTNCRFFGFASGTYNMNGCDYVFHTNGAFDVECPAGNATVLTFGNRELRMGTQTGMKSVSLSNNANHISMQLNVSGITVNVTKDGFLCPFTGTGHKSATYVQEEAITVQPVSGGTSISVD